MKYPYRPTTRGTQTIYTPQLDITVHGRDGSIAVRALVDSGADTNVVPVGMPDEIGKLLVTAQTVKMSGIEGNPHLDRLAHVQIQFGSHRWVAPAIFSFLDLQIPILGREGFFSDYRVCIDENAKQMDIVRRRAGH